MDTSFIRGVIAPIVTPLDVGERVERHGLRRVVEHVIAGGVHGIMALGSNGEFFGLDWKQQQIAVATTLRQVDGRVPVYRGIGAITTNECIRMAKSSEDEGVQAITVLPPMFLTLNDEELFQHFQAIAESTSLPVLLYNNPDRVKTNLSVNLMERLAAIPNVVGVKDSSGDLELTGEYIRRTRGKHFKVFAGRDSLILGTLAYGGAGCVASTANILPSLVVEIFERFVGGDLPGSLDAQFKLTPLRMAFNLGSFPAVTKDAMNLLGLQIGSPIKPIASCSVVNLETLKEVLKTLGALS